MKGKGFLELTEFEKAVDALSKLVEYDPENEDGRKEYERA